MSATMIDIMVNDLKTFSPLSSTFNSIVSLAATGEENDHGGGFERRVGDHAVTLSSQTVHFGPEPHHAQTPREEFRTLYLTTQLPKRFESMFSV